MTAKYQASIEAQEIPRWHRHFHDKWSDSQKFISGLAYKLLYMNKKIKQRSTIDICLSLVMSILFIAFAIFFSFSVFNYPGIGFFCGIAGFWLLNPYSLKYWSVLIKLVKTSRNPDFYPDN